MVKSRMFLRAWFALLGLLSVGCSVIDEDVGTQSFVVPTTNPIFLSPITPENTPVTMTVEPQIDDADFPEDDGAMVPETAVAHAIIFNDKLNPNWNLQASSGNVSFSLRHTASIHSGRNALSIMSLPAYETLHFQVRQNTIEQYRREEIVSITFWLFSDAETIKPGSINLVVTGSDNYPYWVANDTSAGDKEDILTYSGTRAYSLGLAHPVPPGTWTQIEVLLDDLAFDPDYDSELVEDLNYEYVTGFYLISDKGIERAVVIDDIELIMTRKEE